MRLRDRAVLWADEKGIAVREDLVRAAKRRAGRMTEEEREQLLVDRQRRHGNRVNPTAAEYDLRRDRQSLDERLGGD